MKERLDVLLVKKGLASSREKAKAIIMSGIVYVDGIAVDESQYGLPNGITTSPSSAYEPLVFPQTVPKNCVFVLGDNRGVSLDSRYADIGMVDVRHVLGEAVFAIYPLDRFGPVE